MPPTSTASVSVSTAARFYSPTVISLYAFNALAEQRGIKEPSASDRLVLTYVGRELDCSDGSFAISYGQLAANCLISPCTVRRAIATAADLGIIPPLRELDRSKQGHYIFTPGPSLDPTVWAEAMKRGRQLWLSASALNEADRHVDGKRVPTVRKAMERASRATRTRAKVSLGT